MSQRFIALRAYLGQLLLELLHLFVGTVKILLQNLSSAAVALAEEHKVRQQREDARGHGDREALGVRVRFGHAELLEERVHL